MEVLYAVHTWKKAKETLKRIQKRHVENSERRALERRKAYLEAKKNGTSDEYFENLKRKTDEMF